LTFLTLGLLSASGPHLYNPSYVKFALAAPDSVVWALESPPYPAKIELGNVTYRMDSERVPVEGYGLVPRAVAAVLDVAVDGVWTRVVVRYGVEEVLELRVPLGFALAGDCLVVVGPTYGKGGVSFLSAMYWNANGGCLSHDGEAPGDYLVGVKPLSFFRIIIVVWWPWPRLQLYHLDV
jgi:hypothetical protein